MEQAQRLGQFRHGRKQALHVERHIPFATVVLPRWSRKICRMCRNQEVPCRNKTSSSADVFGQSLGSIVIPKNLVIKSAVMLRGHTGTMQLPIGRLHNKSMHYAESWQMK